MNANKVTSANSTMSRIFLFSRSCIFMSGLFVVVGFGVLFFGPHWMLMYLRVMGGGNIVARTFNKPIAAYNNII